ncbi:MAG: hypothetical protein ACI97A_001252 [Planctomycetota bacterium]|jgi:hypothetical protein
MRAAVLIISILACQLVAAQTNTNTKSTPTPEQMSTEARRNNAVQVMIDGKSEAFPGRLAAAAEAARILANDSVHSQKLVKAVETGTGLMTAFDLAIADLTFRPRKEAKSPAGFPDYTPVGMIETKSYPGYRQVQTQMGGILDDQRAFFRLFSHIQENEIAMTSPVPVERGADGKKTMSFLYGDASIGEQKFAGKVKVLDVKPVTVVSIGMRYRDSRKATQAAVAILENWLAENSETWVAAGGWRTMGWNSPMVRSSQRYWEVQIPVRLKVSEL